MAKRKSAAIIQLRKCVLLRRELNDALGRMIDMLDGTEHDNYTAHAWKLIDDEFNMLNDGADSPSDIDVDAFDELSKTWNESK